MNIIWNTLKCSGVNWTIKFHINVDNTLDKTNPQVLTITTKNAIQIEACQSLILERQITVITQNFKVVNCHLKIIVKHFNLNEIAIIFLL